MSSSCALCRTLRTAMRPSSAFFFTSLARSLRRSSLSGGIASRIDRAVDVGRQTEIALFDGLANRRNDAFVPGGDQQRPRVGSRNASHLLERNRLAVRFNDEPVEQRRYGSPGANRSELAARRVDALMHFRLDFVEIGIGHVLRSSPRALLRVAQRRFRSARPRSRGGCCPEPTCRKRSTGSALSMQSAIDVESMTSKPSCKTSRYSSRSKRVARGSFFGSAV